MLRAIQHLFGQSELTLRQHTPGWATAAEHGGLSPPPISARPAGHRSATPPHGTRSAYAPTELAAMSAADRLTAIQTAVPAEHRSFLASLLLSWKAGEYVFVHAGVRPGVTIENQSLLWIRGPFLDSDVSLGAIVVHGHTPVAEPDFRRYRINIDTGAYLSGRLTCMKIDAESPVLLPTSPRTTGLA